MKTHFPPMTLIIAVLIILAGGCASSSSPVETAAPAPAAAPSGAVYIKQRPMTSYMQSQVGTPNELSPVAPAEARNVRKIGDHWLCEINGRTMIFNDASSCWEPHGE